MTRRALPISTTRPAVRLVLSVVTCAVLTGCNSSDLIDGPNKRFDSAGFGVTFQYPAVFEEKALQAGGGAVGRPDDIVRELTLTNDDFIAVRRDPVEQKVLAGGTDSLKAAVDQLAQVLNPKVSPARPVTIGGMPGFEYLGVSPGAQHRYLFFAGKDVLYLIHCRSTDEHRAEIAAACDTVQRTLNPV